MCVMGVKVRVCMCIFTLPLFLGFEGHPINQLINTCFVPNFIGEQKLEDVGFLPNSYRDLLYVCNNILYTQAVFCLLFSQSTRLF